MRRTEATGRALALLVVVASVAAAAAGVPVAAAAQREGTQEQATAQPPRVRIEQVRSVRLQGRQALVDLVLRVSNPGAWGVSLDDIRFRCSFNGTATAQGHSTGALNLPPHGNAEVPVVVDIDASALLAVLAALPPDGVVQYRLDGDAELGRTLLRIPFHEQGSVVLRVG